MFYQRLTDPPLHSRKDFPSTTDNNMQPSQDVKARVNGVVEAVQSQQEEERHQSL